MTGRKLNDVRSFWSKVDKSDIYGCWPWKASLRNGYGHHTENYKTVYAHRYAYCEAYGHLPPSGHIMHICNNKACCNPDHLVAGTVSENTRAAYADGLIPVGANHASAKYPDKIVAAIRADPRPQLEIARLYGVSQSHISRIKNHQSRSRAND